MDDAGGWVLAPGSGRPAFLAEAATRQPRSGLGVRSRPVIRRAVAQRGLDCARRPRDDDSYWISFSPGTSTSWADPHRLTRRRGSGPACVDVDRGRRVPARRRGLLRDDVLCDEGPLPSTRALLAGAAFAAVCGDGRIVRGAPAALGRPSARADRGATPSFFAPPAFPASTRRRLLQRLRPRPSHVLDYDVVARPRLSRRDPAQRRTRGAGRGIAPRFRAFILVHPATTFLRAFPAAALMLVSSYDSFATTASPPCGQSTREVVHPSSSGCRPDHTTGFGPSGRQTVQTQAPSARTRDGGPTPATFPFRRVPPFPPLSPCQ